MDNKLKIQEEIAEIAPFLAKIKKENAYRVPTDYFERMEEAVMEQIAPAKEHKITTGRSPLDQLADILRQLFAPGHRWQLAGLSAIILGVAFLWFTQNDTDTSSMDIMANISEEEVNEYIESNIDEFDVEFLANYMVEQSIDIDEQLLDMDGVEIDDLLDDILDEMEFDEFDTIDELL